MSRFPGVRLNLTTSTMSIYRHASEILHGTYFGVEFFWTAGGSNPPSRAGFERTYVNNHLIAIFTAVFAAANGMLEVIAEEFDIPELRRRYSEQLGKSAELLVPKAEEAEAR